VSRAEVVAWKVRRQLERLERKIDQAKIDAYSE
jgi:hypothetical protein